MNERAAGSYPPLLVAGVAVLAGLFVLSRHNFLLFHGLVELFSIAVAWSVFLLVWSMRRISSNDALLFIGIAFGFIGFIDIFHTLAYKGMGIFAAEGATNIANQLCIASLGLESASLVLFPFLLDRRFPAPWAVAGFAVVTGLLLASISLWFVFPECYVEGRGLTGFKKGVEYASCLALLVAMASLHRRRGRLDGDVFRLMMSAMAVAVASELAFTLYTDPFGLSNAFGHILKIVSFFLVYLALVRSGVASPHETLFKKLADSNRQLDAYREQLESLVEKKTGELRREISVRTQAQEELKKHRERLEEQVKKRTAELQREIAEHKRTEASLRESELQFRRVFERTPNAVFLVDTRTGGLLDANEAGLRLAGRSLEELKEFATSDIALEGPKKCLSMLATSEENTSLGEVVFLQPGGSRRIAQLTSVPLREGLLAAIAVDITERKRTEEALEKRLIALTRPLEDSQGLTFEELFNLEDIQRLQDQFADATGVASIITRPDGTPITRPSNFCRLCNDIVRKTEKGLVNCKKSDAVLGRYSPEGAVFQPCLSCGLWDAGAGIAVGGRHIANWLVGQVRDETQTDENVRAYARRIGTDEKEAVAAFHEVTVMSRERFEKVAQALFSLASQLSSMAYQNVQQARFIGEKRRAEEELRQSEETYRGLMENLNAGVVLHGPDTSILYANPRACDLLGISENRIMGKQSTDWDGVFLREDGSELPLEEYPVVRVLLSNEPLRNMVGGVRRARTGDIVWLLVNGFALRDESGKLEKAIVTFVDITERKRAEVELKESEERFRALHNASFGGIAIHDKGLILECNKGLSEMTGYEHDELIGMDGLRLISDDTRDKVIANINAGYEKPYEAQGVRKNGEIFPIRVEARNIPYKGKNVRVVEFRDITESKRAEEEKENLEGQLRQAQKMEAVGRLAGGVAHDFNNMLGVILGHVDLIMDDVGPEQPIHAFLSEIKTAGQRSAELTRQLLAFARKQTVSPRVIDLNEIVSGMTRMLQRLIGEDIDLVWKPGEKVWPVRIDPSQIDQILANLCVNARDAIAGVGRIVIETQNSSFDEDSCENCPGFLPGDYVTLAVSDDGSGMDPETLEHLFEPFFTTKEEGKGTGLGLATVYGAVKQNNGGVDVFSEPGRGTTFKIHLPRHLAKPARSPEKGPGKKAERGHETILLVEDEEAILSMTVVMLERLGYTVVAAATPSEAIELARQYKGEIHLLATDVVMPEMNGRDLARSILSFYPDIKRLFMSGYTADVIAHHGVLAERVNFLQKPFSIKSLGAKVREALGCDRG